MLWTAVLWTFLFVAILGLGLLVTAALRRWGGVSCQTPATVFQTFWLGYVAVIVTLEVWSLLLPIRGPAVVFVAVVAVVGYAASFGAVLRSGIWLAANRARAVGILFTTVATWLTVAYRAAGPVDLYDTHLYHLQVVRWNARFPVVPGLANIHCRFGFDSSLHLFGALTDALWLDRSAHLADGFLLAVVISQWCAEILSAASVHSRLRQAFCLLTLPFLLQRLWGPEVASLSSDLALAIIAMATCLELFSLEPSTRLDLPRVRALGLAAVAYTTKMGGLSLVAVAAVVAALTLRSEHLRSRRTAILVAVPGAVLLPYFVRHAVISGWLFDPVPFGNLHLSWSRPAEITELYYRGIQSWARIPGPEDALAQGFLHWFVPWFDRFRSSRELVLVVASVALLLARMTGTTPRPSPERRIPEWSTLAVGLVGLALWFNCAPDVRFGAFLFWIVFAAACAPMLAVSSPERSPLVPFLLSIGLTCWAGGIEPTFAAPADWWQLPPVAAPPTRTVSSEDGYPIVVPVKGDQCGNAELPCTPSPGLVRMRRPGSLRAGFLAVNHL